tara:strand:+ start:1716 stop:3029 length:1314 start_codon:yes stop_codon:yes gene_type:complete
MTIQQTGLFWTTGTADTGGSTSVLTDAALTRWATDSLNGHHILVTSGSPTYTELFITKFFQDDGDCLFRPEEGAALDALTYEILPFSGTDILRAVQDSILTLYDQGLLSRNLWMRMMGGSPIYNADFSYWTSSTAVDGWTVTDAAVARERASANLALSETSVRLHTEAGHLDLDAQWQRYLNDFKGSTVTLYCWVKTSAASNARIALYDGSTINYSAYHGGDGDWELLHVEVSTENTDTEFEPRLYIDTTSEAYFNFPWVRGGLRLRPRVTTYPFAHQVMPDGPYEIKTAVFDYLDDEIASGRGLGTLRQLGPQRNITEYRVIKHHDENTTTQVGLLDLSKSRRPPTDGLILLLRGDGPLTVPTSALSTDNLEVTESESLLLATTAAITLLEKSAAGSPSSTRRTYATRIAELRQQAGVLSMGAGESRDAATYSVGW